VLNTRLCYPLCKRASVVAAKHCGVCPGGVLRVEYATCACHFCKHDPVAAAKHCEQV